MDVTSPAHRGRDVRTNYQFRPSAEVTGFKLIANSSAGTVNVVFPDGWSYGWSGVSQMAIWTLLAGSVGYYNVGSLPQGLVLTDHGSAELCLLRCTRGRLFATLGPPSTAVKIAAPLAIDIQWNVGFDWTPLVWSHFTQFPGSWSVTFKPAGTGPETSPFIHVTASPVSGRYVTELDGDMTYNGPAASSSFKVSLSTTGVSADFFQFYGQIEQNGSQINFIDLVGFGQGTFTQSVSIADTGGVSQSVHVRLRIATAGTIAVMPNASVDVVLG